ncbi:uncharacterized protein DUF4957 [Neolewinella xylanilytica]|uniref:Uncharacterized protein DUF4957 n=1 Tax=Neolewinella xylanilytica TaxID=1514080 RepID=A0A2S6IB70_9BACT|nr:DUF5123 domain-containing protein [Neolewinella xylanilytica]PPK88754.1 uncharacterized protein DUF4957 [Neolewinella xylanilytica]
MQYYKLTMQSLLLLIGCTVLFVSGCEEEEIYEETRLFRPVLQEPLESELNTIIVNIGNIKEAVSYTIEVSRDSFATVLYTFETDTSYFIIDETKTGGEPLLYATLYQVRATAHAEEEAFDSRPSELGDVRTQRFPSILAVPTTGDVIDTQVRLLWQQAGEPVSTVRVFARTDERLTDPLLEYAVEQDSGIYVVRALQPETEYIIGIYSGPDGEILRGYEFYTTIASAITLSNPTVIDLSNSSDADTLNTVIANANDGDTIVLQKGFVYNFPSDPLDKSLTFASAYGFGSERPVMFTTGNWDIADGATIDHVRFIDIELRGEDRSGDYVFNPNKDTRTVLNNLTFENCLISTFRGIIRIRTQMFLGNYTINNSIVHDIGGYGILTTDTDGVGMAAVDNITLTNSTFYRVETFFQSRQNAQSVRIDNCTFYEVGNGGGGILFRWRGEEGLLSNVINGITITNSIWGPGWDQAATGATDVSGINDGLENTSFNIVNTYATSGFTFTAGSEIPGFPAISYSGTAEQLWVAPDEGNFNFADTGFAGRNDAGDPRWRPF